MAKPSRPSDQIHRKGRDLPDIHSVDCRGCGVSHRYNSLIRTGPSVVVCLSPDHRILEFNRAAEQLHGQPKAAVLGQNFLKLFVPGSQRDAVAANIKQALDGQQTRNFEISILTPDGMERILLWNLSRILDAAEHRRGVIAIGQDITERKQAEQALIKYKDQLRVLASELALAGQRERRRVAVGLHDQVGQALAMVKLKLGSVLSSELPAPTRGLLEESQALLNGSIQAVRSLTFELSSAVLHELGLEAALQQLVEWFDAEYPDTQFVFESDNLPKPAGEDQGAVLYDIARELLFNAAKHARARSARLRVERVDDQIRITINDDGVGFDTACLAHGISLDGGFGYFSIRERLAYLGGELEIESSIGHGTRIVAAAPIQAS